MSEALEKFGEHKEQFVKFYINTVFENHRKVSFNIANEASYFYILSGQKLIQNAKKLSILASFWKAEACGQTIYQTGQF